MKEFIEKLIERLEEEIETTWNVGYKNGLTEAKRIVNQLAVEYINTSTDTSTDISTTNADRIRSMTDEELAEFLLKVNTAYAEPCMIGEKDCKWEDYPTHDKGCKDCFLDWLQSEVEGVTENE